VREEKDFLNRCGTHPEVYTLEKFEAKINTFGTLSLMLNYRSNLRMKSFIRPISNEMKPR
jgi:hypothetical protein